MLKKSLVTALMAASLPAIASDYFVVVPVPARTAAAQNISVSLAGNALPAGLLGLPYAGFDFRSLLSVTGDSNYTGYGVHWSVVGGSLPAGLTLNSDGTLSGIPTAPGTSSFQVMASYKTKAGQQAYQVVVAHITVALGAGSPPQALAGQAYSYDLKPLLTVTGDSAYTGPGQVAWTVVSSTLPTGLYLTNDGFIGGTPTAAGTGSVTARATYKGLNGQQTYQVVSLAVTVRLGNASLPAGEQGAAYSFDLKPSLSVTGDPAFSGAGVTWSVVSGTLPAGLTLGTDGVISGTPTAENAASPFTIQAVYKNGIGQQSYAVLVGAITVALTGATVPAMTAGTATTYDLKPNLTISGDAAYSGDGTGVTWTVSTGTLPAGLALGTDGRITGTPLTVGSSSVSVTAAYKNKTTTAAAYNMSVSANIANSGAYRSWSDGTFAASCQGYLSPNGTTYKYAGATGNGVYRIKPAGTTVDVYCDQTTDGGGWALVQRAAGGSAFAQANWAVASAVNVSYASTATAPSSTTSWKFDDATLNQIRSAGPNGVYRMMSDGLVNQKRFFKAFTYATIASLTVNSPATVSYADLAWSGAKAATSWVTGAPGGLSDDGGTWDVYFDTSRGGDAWALSNGQVNSFGAPGCTASEAGCNYTMWVR